MSKKRLIVCVIGGIIAGFICIMGIKSTGRMELTTPIILSTFGNRILIGFVIGISCWKMNYLLHGALMGLIVTLSASIIIIFDSLSGFWMYTIAGVIYGLLIELCATKLFKAPMT